MQKLNEILDAALRFNGPDFYKNQVPEYIYSNLKSGFGKRPYQQEAFGRFVFFLNDYHDRPKGVSTQLLYHMATGSGKTLVMAGIILYLYSKGYRNFIFFVNSTNIIEKTKDNFLNSASSKYLFNDDIIIDGHKIEIREVDNFEAVSPDDINIVFATVQGMHKQLNTPRENSITYQDFSDKKVVLLSDEAHHINADTKKGKLSSDLQQDIISWEGTVNKIFHTNRDNLLLEFTATSDLDNENIREKYSDKLLFDYPLKQFRIDKYSKDVLIHQADLDPFPRALKAVLLNQYRRKIFEDYGLHIKPVILFKSKTIKESQHFFCEFVTGIKSLDVGALQEIRTTNREKAYENIFAYFDARNISLENLILELQEDFSEDKCIAVDSKNDSEQKQMAINSLEDDDNEYRAVFAVDKLNEGWDVLNLFDIVRLYNTRDSDHKAGKIGATTMSEAQLIGRGARYCPFKISDEDSLYQRKYDENLEHPLRICEELYYHSSHNPKYISELNKALEEIGLKAPKTVQRTLKLKDSFKETDCYERGLIFINERVPQDRSDINALAHVIRNKIYKINFSTGFSSTSYIFEETDQKIFARRSATWSIKDFGDAVIRKALNKTPFFRFDNLQFYFPNLKSISEFMSSEKYLGNIRIEISGPEELVEKPPKEAQLKAVMHILLEISEALPKGMNDFEGSRIFRASNISYIFKDKTLNYSLSESLDKETGIAQSETTNTNLLIDLAKEEWYAYNENYGTSEEKYLVKFIKEAYHSLKNNYDDIYLLRNEKHFSLYNFEDGRAFEPDFVLFLKEKNTHKPIIFQTFIEPKGGHLIEGDRWKEDFLLRVAADYRMLEVFSNTEYRLLGMPFYNENTMKKEFSETFYEKFKSF